MKSPGRRTSLLLGLLLILLLAAYFFPIPTRSFEDLSASVPAVVSQSLIEYRQQQPLKSLLVGDVRWSYRVDGEGAETILFLHGMTGSADFWWQQILALRTRYSIIAVSYPAVHSLGEMSTGLLAILDAEGASQVTIVGSSLGGYLAQYFAARHPERVARAVFGNTFPPNELLNRQYGLVGRLIPIAPPWVVMQVLRSSAWKSLYPASGNSELLLALQLEQTYGHLAKDQVLARYRCVMEKFIPPDLQTLGIPVLIIESSNDPLVEPRLRGLLKAVYPSAGVVTLQDVGHFPYVSHPELYLDVLTSFLAGGSR